MARYLLDGEAMCLVIAGQTIIRGLATDLSGPAAEAAELHPDLVRLDPDEVPDAFAERRALVARAKALGIAPVGKSAALRAAIAAAEARES
ncbi:MAG TPA: hypothetical protein VLH81_12670 [Desulfobacterales bacterium]|nr:hypothetical protein [Desulfobacterales bacterium]